MSDKMVFHAKSIRKGEDHGQIEEISRCSIVVVFQEVSFWIEPVGMVPYATVAYVNEE
ncbi:hypothetical protein BS50DRAFT_580637 [Corynespora cassiicola Philippines]|uniref:Uncharacterized protein n=1 Tax=Corynespora cassiicola Philippines TaxID=1448308 RepID=A0A2T2MZB6_CORCC|nr:hypothetical protein BS50DRAFT_580637 [Corynespora cassiicola Philippines]